MSTKGRSNKRNSKKSKRPKKEPKMSDIFSKVESNDASDSVMTQEFLSILMNIMVKTGSLDLYITKLKDDDKYQISYVTNHETGKITATVEIKDD